MIDEITEQLQRLQGLQLRAVGRAGDLEWFTFVSQDGEETALHVLCPWRLSRDSQILVGAADYWRPPSEDTSAEAFERGAVGARLRDVLNENARSQLADNSPLVVAAIADSFGGFKLDLEDDYVLEIFPDGSTAPHDEIEFWRLFVPGQTHFE